MCHRLFLPVVLLLATAATAQPQSQLNLMPMPSGVQVGVGHLPINRSFSVAISGNRDVIVERGVQRFVAQLSRQTGILLQPGAVSGTQTLVVSAEHGSKSVQEL